VSEAAYRDRIDLLERRIATLEDRRLREIDRVVRLEAEGAEQRIVAGHRRQAERYEQMAAAAQAEAAGLRETIENGVVAWVGGRPTLPELPPLSNVPLSLSEASPAAGQSEPKRATAPQTAAAKRLARARERRVRAPRLTVLATASGRAGRAALAREVHALEDWLDDVGHADAVEIAAVHAHRLPNLEPAFEHRRPAVVHVVGRARKPEALRAALAGAGESLRVVFLSAGRSLEEAGRLAETVPVALGSPRGLDGEVKLAFAAVFYAALAHGLSAAESFERAQGALAAAKMTSGEGPRMFARLSADPTSIRVAAPLRRAPRPQPEDLPASELRAA
jgi:hypothetical protein